MAQRAEESIQGKLGGRVRSGEGSGDFPWERKEWKTPGDWLEGGWCHGGGIWIILYLRPMFGLGEFPSISSYKQPLRQFQPVVGAHPSTGATSWRKGGIVF